MTRPAPKSVAARDHILAVLRDADQPLTAAEIAEQVGTVPCWCTTAPYSERDVRADHQRGGRRSRWVCDGTGFKHADGNDIRPLLLQLERAGHVGADRHDGTVEYVAVLRSVPVADLEAALRGPSHQRGGS